MGEMTDILCVAYERCLVEQLRRLFTNVGKCDIRVAGSGEEALNILNTAEIRLVVSDYRIPDMDGVEFFTRVNNDWPNTVSILLAEQADTEAVAEAIESGLKCQMIIKSWNDVALKAALSSALMCRDLQLRNLRLEKDLQEKSAQLEALNDNIEQLVAKRTEVLEIRNRVLKIPQEILDVLPVVIFGIDSDGMIVSCNDLARDLFPCDVMGPLGRSCRQLFSNEINALIGQLETDPAPRVVVEVKGQTFRAEARPLDESVAQGMLLALIPE